MVSITRGVWATGAMLLLVICTAQNIILYLS